MRSIRGVLLSACLLLASPVLASGTLGIFAVIDRVVFEPNAEAPERVQVFGAFAYYAGQLGTRSLYSDAVRGYLYFSLPSRGNPDIARREWADLAAVAGTREAVAFGGYFFSGSFDGISPDGQRDPAVSGHALDGFGNILAVRPVGTEPTMPSEYVVSDPGVVRLGAGNYDDVVDGLTALLDD